MTLEYSIPSVEKAFQVLPPSAVIEVVGFGSSSSVKKLYSQYPMKLIVPRTSINNSTKVAIIVRYSGGIAQKQVTSLKASVSCGANLVLLTRGPNKIFNNSLHHPTAQGADIEIHSNSSCMFLLDPVVCFEDSIYHQNHFFKLKDQSSSLVALDWYSSGHKVEGEEWKLRSYFSNIQISLGDELVARDIVSLNQDNAPLSQRLTHTNIANVYVIGPHFQSLANSLLQDFTTYKVSPHSFHKNIMWSVTPLEEVSGVILRISSKDTDPLRFFLRERFAPLNLFLDPTRIFT